MGKDGNMPGFMIYKEVGLALSLVPDEEAGKVIKAAVSYYRCDEVTNLPMSAALIFDLIRESIDKGREKYKAQVEGGKKGGNAHWHKE